MKKYLLFIIVLLILTACNKNNNKKNYSGKQLLKDKCSSCHNLDLPAIWTKSELAPPIMAVTFHVYDLVDKNIATKLISSKKFIIDYVISPNINKSLCDKDSLKQYGLMPSQKENITKEELEAISSYMLSFYTKEHLYKIQKDKDYLNSLKPGHKLAIKYKCLSCHKLNKTLVGPSFKNIALKTSIQDIKNSIKNGSKLKYSKAIMPPFKNINNNELNIISKWIKDVK
jgi:cytochrome c